MNLRIHASLAKWSNHPCERSGPVCCVVATISLLFASICYIKEKLTGGDTQLFDVLVFLIDSVVLVPLSSASKDGIE